MFRSKSWPAAILRGLGPCAIFSVGLISTQANAFIKGVDSVLPNNGNSELVFIAWDNNAPLVAGGDILPKVAFIKDLGVGMDAFFVSAQQDKGAQSYWYLGGTGTGIEGDAAWTVFLNTEVRSGVKVDPSKVKWAVFALDGDFFSPTYQADDYKLFTTLRQGTSGSATVISGLSNVTTDQLSKATGGMTTFLGATNALPSHTGAANANGSSVALATQGESIFPFTSANVANIGSNYDLLFTGAIDASAGNLIGKSSWFYKIGRNSSEFDNTLPVEIDEFDNLGGDGYWGLAAASEAGRAGQYFLSYTIAAFASTKETSGGLLYANNFARLGGALSLSSSAGKGNTVLDLSNSFLRTFAKGRIQASDAPDGRAFVTALRDATPALSEGYVLTSAVPEPGTYLLFGAGLGLLAWRARQRR